MTKSEPVPAAWRAAARVVTAVGQVLLWLLTWAGRLLSPITTRLVGALYGGGEPPGQANPRAAPNGTLYAPRQPPGRPPPLLRWATAWRGFAASWTYAPITGGVLAIAALAELPLHGLAVLSLPAVFALAATVPLMFRGEAPRPAAAIVLGALAASLLSGQRLLATTALAGLYTLYLLAQRLPRQQTGVLGVGSLVVVIVVYRASGSLSGIPWPAALAAVLAALGLGDARRSALTAEAGMDEERERTSETLTRLNAVRREQAVLRERARIARELHDVVAHSVSMIAVQAETAPYTMRDLSPEARKGFAEVAGAAREALDEMRRLLTVLRAEPGEDPEVTPQPRLDRLPELIDMHRGAGGEARLAVRGKARPLSTTIELSAYRIVQEALTNARRHAPGARVLVELDYLGDRLAVRVTDDGAVARTAEGGVRHPARTPARGPGSPPPPTIVDWAPGHGLVGMRERTTMLGGRFVAGPRAEGGFAVRAELPVGQNRQP